MKKINSGKILELITISSSEGRLTVCITVKALVFSVTSGILQNIERKLYALRPEELIIDLSNVLIIDSSAVGMLISLKQIMKKNGTSISLVGTNENVQKILNYLNVMVFLTAA